MSVASADGLLVGVEIHQQLSSSAKLFCACPPVKSEEFPYRFERRLRPAESETGGLDPAALFEYAKGKSNVYFWSPESSCLVDADEEPPHPLNQEALEAALLVATVLRSNIVDEVHVMRKMVIDGSNTGGFQRTAVVGLSGGFKVNGDTVGVQSVTLEEDAARIIGEDDVSRMFALDRLGLPLVEIALEPVPGDPQYVERVALHIGRILRSTGRVARGLGTIRQDLNVSYRGGNVVEVKGVQKLNLIQKVVDYERRRQSGLYLLSERLRERGLGRLKCKRVDVTGLLRTTTSEVLRRTVEGQGIVSCIVAHGIGGLVGWEPTSGVRLGKELAEVARANFLGGIIHSDEFGKQGVSIEEEADLKEATGCGESDALILVAGSKETVDRVVPLLVARIKQAPEGVPAETRAATESGETRYMRPRPGSQRMYPETDIPTIQMTVRSRARFREMVQEDWTAKVRKLQSEYGLSGDQALKLFDSDSADEFERLTSEVGLEPSFVATVIVDVPARLAREGVPEGGYVLPVLAEVLRSVDKGRAAKEAVPEILEQVGRKGISVDEAIRSLGLTTVGEKEVDAVIDHLVAREAALIREKGAASFSALMGEAMRELRGKADGAVVANRLRDRIDRFTREK